MSLSVQSQSDESSLQFLATISQTLSELSNTQPTVSPTRSLLIEKLMEKMQAKERKQELCPEIASSSVDSVTEPEALQDGTSRKCDGPENYCEKRKRTVLDTSPRDILCKWFEEHRNCPYLSSVESKKLETQTGLPHQQVSRFIANQRRKLRSKSKSETVKRDKRYKHALANLQELKPAPTNPLGTSSSLGLPIESASPIESELPIKWASPMMSPLPMMSVAQPTQSNFPIDGSVGMAPTNGMLWNIVASMALHNTCMHLQQLQKHAIILSNREPDGSPAMTSCTVPLSLSNCPGCHAVVTLNVSP